MGKDEVPSTVDFSTIFNKITPPVTKHVLTRGNCSSSKASASLFGPLKRVNVCFCHLQRGLVCWCTSAATPLESLCHGKATMHHPKSVCVTYGVFAGCLTDGLEFQREQRDLARRGARRERMHCLGRKYYLKQPTLHPWMEAETSAKSSTSATAAALTSTEFVYTIIHIISLCACVWVCCCACGKTLAL